MHLLVDRSQFPLKKAQSVSAEQSVPLKVSEG